MQTAANNHNSSFSLIKIRTRVALQIAHRIVRKLVVGDAVLAQVEILDRAIPECLGRGVKLLRRQVGLALDEFGAAPLLGLVQQV